MTLAELKESVDNAIEWAEEYGEPTDEIKVSLQVFIWDGKDATKGNQHWADEDVKVHYDNNGLASGCVLTASRKTNLE